MQIFVWFNLLLLFGGFFIEFIVLCKVVLKAVQGQKWSSDEKSGAILLLGVSVILITNAVGLLAITKFLMEITK